MQKEMYMIMLGRKCSDSLEWFGLLTCYVNREETLSSIKTEPKLKE